MRDALESVDSRRAAATAAEYTFSPRLTDECAPSTRRNPMLGELQVIDVERKVDGLDAVGPGRICSKHPSTPFNPSVQLSVGVTGIADLLEIEGYLLKDRDPVGLSASRSVGFSNRVVLIGRTGFDTTYSIPDPTLSLSQMPPT